MFAPYSSCTHVEELLLVQRSWPLSAPHFLLPGTAVPGITEAGGRWVSLSQALRGSCWDLTVGSSALGAGSLSLAGLNSVGHFASFRGSIKESLLLPHT